jgi:transposase
MEDILDLYGEPPDPHRPRICVEERPYQLVGEVRPPQPAGPGRPCRQDYEYERRGVCNLFVCYCPDEGRRQVQVRARRTGEDFAHFIKALVDEHYPQAHRLRLVTDNLNTHKPAVFYQVFPPEEARRLASKLEWHYTPEHGSWLNQVELELAVLSRQCLERRLPDAETLQREVAAWQQARDAQRATIDWRFRTKHARTKLKRLYPNLS